MSYNFEQHPRKAENLMLNIRARSRDRICGDLEGNERSLLRTDCPSIIKFGIVAVVFVLALFAGQATANAQGTHAEFVNVVDSTQGYSQFSQFPAINDQGAVAFVATQDGAGQGIFKWERRELKPIASTTGSIFSFFTDDVVINAPGVVGFRATLNTGGRAAGIFTSDGLSTKTIINSAEQGLPGPGISSPSMNASGTVAFQASRNFFRSAVIFTGNGGALTPVLDTLNSDFGSFGNVAINASGKIVFRGILKDRNEGVFVIAPGDDKSDGLPAGPASLLDVIDTINNPDFFQFGDPVINDAGAVADFVGVSLGVEVFTGKAGGIAPNDPVSVTFADAEHPSINNRGAIAFSAFEANGAQGIFVALTAGTAPVAVLQTGDPLFGSTVTAVSVGRFAFNEHLQLTFEYELADGRSGIAVASLQVGKEGQGEGLEEK